MASSKIDICNLALSHIGDVSNVTDLNEQSAQSDHCKRYYPIALNLLLEQHEWSFATRRKAGALLSEPPASQWQYCYQVPADAVKVFAVLPEGGLDRESVPFTMESLDSGDRIIFCDWPNVTLRYVALIDNPTVYTPQFSVTLSWLLASYLAGPILKGDAGRSAAQTCNQVYLGNLAQAKASDANQQQIAETYVPQGIRARHGGAGLPPFGRNVR